MVIRAVVKYVFCSAMIPTLRWEDKNVCKPTMKKISTTFLRAVTVLVGIGALAFMLWEPTVDGVNAHATTLSEIYFDDPFLAYAYTTSIAFFIALYQAFTLLGYIGQNEAFSQHSLKASRIIKYCAITLVVLVAAPVVYLFIVRSGDDIAGGVAMGLFIIFVSAVVAIAAAVFEKRLRR